MTLGAFNQSPERGALLRDGRISCWSSGRGSEATTPAPIGSKLPAPLGSGSTWTRPPAERTRLVPIDGFLAGRRGHRARLASPIAIDRNVPVPIPDSRVISGVRGPPPSARLRGADCALRRARRRARRRHGPRLDLGARHHNREQHLGEPAAANVHGPRQRGASGRRRHRPGSRPWRSGRQSPRRTGRSSASPATGASMLNPRRADDRGRDRCRPRPHHHERPGLRGHPQHPGRPSSGDDAASSTSRRRSFGALARRLRPGLPCASTRPPASSLPRIARGDLPPGAPSSSRST